MGKELTPEERAIFEGFKEQESARPMKYLKWETNFADDDSIRQLRDGHGWEYLAYYLCLMLLLAKREKHFYRLDTQAQVYYLAHDMWLSEERLLDALDVFASLELINSEAWNAHKMVYSAAVNKRAEKQGEDGAWRRFGAHKRHNS